MCGRLALPDDLKEIAGRHYKITMPVQMRFNVAPTTQIPAIAVREGEETLDAYRWGIVPFWSKDGKLDLFNARDDKVATSSSYKGWITKSRCVVPASYFYEWQKTTGGKVPHAIHRTDGQPLLLAGVWAMGQDPKQGGEVQSACLFTTRPNGVMERLHNRMPVILEPDQLDAWLDPELKDLAELQLFLQPSAEEVIEAYPVSDAVNRVGNEGPQLLAPRAA